MDDQKESDSGSHKIYVYQKRDWKEYFGESLLIIFSVLLALILTEYLNKLHERRKTKEMLRSIVIELNHNKKAIEEMKVYDLIVLKKIDSALINVSLQNKLVGNDEFHLNIIAPDGILFRYLDKDSWVVAKNNDILSKIDIESVSILTKVYEDLDKMSKVEDEVAKVIFDRASRDPKQIHATLIIIRDIYHGWAVDRIPGLLSQIDAAIAKVEADYR